MDNPEKYRKDIEDDKDPSFDSSIILKKNH